MSRSRPAAAVLAALLALVARRRRGALRRRPPTRRPIAHVESTTDGLQLLVVGARRRRGRPRRRERDRRRHRDRVDRRPGRLDDDRRGAPPSSRSTPATRCAASASRPPRPPPSTFLDTVPDDVYVGIVSFDGDVDRGAGPDASTATPRAPSSRRSSSARRPGSTTACSPPSPWPAPTASARCWCSPTAPTPATPSSTTSPRAVKTLGRARRRRLARADGRGRGRPAPARRRPASGQVIDADPEALAGGVHPRGRRSSPARSLVTAEVPASVTATEATIAVTLPSTARHAHRRGLRARSARAPPRAADAGRRSARPPTAAWCSATPGCTPASGALGRRPARGPARCSCRDAKRELTPAEERASMYTDRLDGRNAGAELEGRAGAGARPGQGRRRQGAAPQQVPRGPDRHPARGRGQPAQARRVAAAARRRSSWAPASSGCCSAAAACSSASSSSSLGAFGPWMFLGLKRSRRRKAFNTQLPDTLQLMSGSLAAGLSLAQSVDTIVREGVEPISSEFKRVLVETRLGVALEDALEGVAERFESKDFGWVVMAIKIQRQVGGNLAELLDTVAAHHARARVHAPPGRRARRGGQALRLGARRSAPALHALPAADQPRLRDACCSPSRSGWLMLGGAGAAAGPRASSG